LLWLNLGDSCVLPAVRDYRWRSSFFLSFLMFLLALELVDFYHTCIQINPVRVIQVFMINKFSHCPLQFMGGYLLRVNQQLITF